MGGYSHGGMRGRFLNGMFDACRNPQLIRFMKTLMVLMLSMSFTLSSCTNGPGARRGTAIGAVGGGVAGGLIGRNLGGVALGAGLGALAGNMIGGASDRRHYRYYH